MKLLSKKLINIKFLISGLINILNDYDDLYLDYPNIDKNIYLLFKKLKNLNILNYSNFKKVIKFTKYKYSKNLKNIYLKLLIIQYRYQNLMYDYFSFCRLKLIFFI